MNNRKKVLIDIVSEKVVKIFFETHAFADIEANCDVYYLLERKLFQRKANVFTSRKTIIHSFDNEYYASRALLRKLFNFKSSPFSFSYRYMFYRSDGTLKRRYPLHKKIKMKPFYRKLFRWIYNHTAIDPMKILSGKRIFPLLVEVLEKFLPGDRRLEEKIKTVNPDVILIPTAAFSNRVIDLFKIGRKFDSKILVQPIGWDNISTKLPIYLSFDQLIERGQQNADLAKKIYCLGDEQVATIGVPHYEMYFDYQKRADLSARKQCFLKKNGISPDKKILLFGGPLRPFNEFPFIEKLEGAISSGQLPETFVIWRPHPKYWKKQKSDKWLNFDEKVFRHVMVDKEVREAHRIATTDYLPDLNNFLDLYYSIDAIITPFSSVLAEAALFGKPILGMACHDGINRGPYSAQVMAKREYFKFFKDCEWYVQCDHESDFINDCRRLLELARQPDIERKVKNEMKYIVYHDERAYTRRLLDVLAQ